jgi:hypothetical protein
LTIEIRLGLAERYKKEAMEPREIVTEVMLILEGLKSSFSSGIRGP